jgi:hypothetical protein
MALSTQPTSRLDRATLGIPDERARYLIQCEIVLKKIDALLLPLMRQHQIDMWITLDREYNPDPFADELAGQGGVRNAHIFFDSGDRLEKVFIFSHPPRADLAPRLYDELIHYGYRPEGLRPYLADAVQKRQPRRIGLNMSPTLPMADGLSVSLKRYLDDAIGPELPLAKSQLSSCSATFAPPASPRKPRRIACWWSGPPSGKKRA